MNKDTTLEYIKGKWDDWYIPGLGDFVRVPNLTPMVDEDYLTNGLVEKCAKLVDDYIQKLDIKGLSSQTFKTADGLPLVVYIVEATEGVTQNVMVYGHLDKQPYGTGWDEDLSPTEPTIKNGRMYGRGASDDGYAPFSCMLGVKAAQEQGVPMPRICLVLETEEESGSPNLVALLKDASELIGTPDACFCMDSGAFDYNSLWITSSLRGICIVDMTVQHGMQGYHSGAAGGIVPDTFRIIRSLLNRLDNVETGETMPELAVPVPEWKQEEAIAMAKLAGAEICDQYSIVEGGKYVYHDDHVKMYMENTWNANLSVTGADGLPPIKMAGNVVRPETSVRLSMRLPPAMDPTKAEAAIREKLTTNVPYGAKVTLKGGHAGAGWCMQELAPWLKTSLHQAGNDFYGKPAGSYGMGGSIPFLSELGHMYPQTQIVALGVLGPDSNAHGPNEMVDLDYLQKMTCCLAHVLQSVANHS